MGHKYGVRRGYKISDLIEDLWDSNGAIVTKRLLKWRVCCFTPLNLDMVRTVVQKNHKLREIDFEIDNSGDYENGDKCRLWKLLHDFVSCFTECSYLAKFSLRISVLPIARYDVETTRIKEILEQRNVQVELNSDSKMIVFDDSGEPNYVAIVEITMVQVEVTKDGVMLYQKRCRGRVYEAKNDFESPTQALPTLAQILLKFVSQPRSESAVKRAHNA